VKDIKLQKELVQSLANVLGEYSSKHKVSVDEVLLTLEYLHACVERSADETPPEKLS
jgi:hypothetical protein